MFGEPLPSIEFRNFDGARFVHAMKFSNMAAGTATELARQLDALLDQTKTQVITQDKEQLLNIQRQLAEMQQAIVVTGMVLSRVYSLLYFMIIVALLALVGVVLLNVLL